MLFLFPAQWQKSFLKTIVAFNKEQYPCFMSSSCSDLNELVPKMGCCLQAHEKYSCATFGSKKYFVDLSDVFPLTWTSSRTKNSIDLFLWPSAWKKIWKLGAVSHDPRPLSRTTLLLPTSTFHHMWHKYTQILKTANSMPPPQLKKLPVPQADLGCKFNQEEDISRLSQGYVFMPLIA